MPTYQILKPLFPGFEIESETEFQKTAFQTAKRISATEIQEILDDGTNGKRWRSVAIGSYVVHNEVQEFRNNLGPVSRGHFVAELQNIGFSVGYDFSETRAVYKSAKGCEIAYCDIDSNGIGLYWLDID